MISNSLIKYFKGLNERSNNISTLLFINTVSSLGITLSFAANNNIVDSIFFTVLFVHSMCLVITYVYSKTHSVEVKKGTNIINNIMNNEAIKTVINDYDFIYNNNEETKDISDEDDKETDESDKENEETDKEVDESDKEDDNDKLDSDKSESDKSESDKSEDEIKEYNSEEYDNNNINQEIKTKDDFKLEFAKKKLLVFKGKNIKTFTGIKNTQEKIDKIISIINNFDYDIDMNDDQVYYDIKQLILLFNEIQLSYSSHNTFKPEIDELFEILELIV